MDYTDMARMLLASSRDCYALPVGRIDSRKRAYQSPETYMMSLLLREDSSARDRFYRYQSESSSTDCEMEFFRLDESQFFWTAWEACTEAYAHVLRTHEDVRTLLIDSQHLPIYYYGGFRSMVLDVSVTNGFGYNIVGHCLMNLRTVLRKRRVPTHKNVRASILESQDTLMIGLVMLGVVHCWNRLVHGQDDLSRFLGKSVFEILSLLGVTYNDETLRKYRAQLSSPDAVRGLEGLDRDDLESIVESEFLHPGNLVGFLRKRGISLYLQSLEQAVYWRLWDFVAQQLLRDDYPDVPPDQYALYIRHNSPPDTVVAKGPLLLAKFLAGKLRVTDPDEHASLTETIRVLRSPDYLRDALFFVPRVYIIQNLGTPFQKLSLYDYVDFDDLTDTLSPCYPYNLVLEEKTFPTILHYIYYKTLSSYFPKKLHAQLYEQSMFDSEHEFLPSVGKPLAERFNELVHQRRIDLLYEGLVLRVRCNPVFFTLLYATKQSPDDLHPKEIVPEGKTDGERAVYRLLQSRTTEFPELSRVCEMLNHYEEGGTPLTLPQIELILRFWIAVWTLLLDWIHTVRIVVPAFVRPTLAGGDAILHIFFALFYPDTLSLLYGTTVEEDSNNNDIPPAIETVASALVEYLSSALGTGGHYLRRSTVLRRYIASYITAVRLYPSDDIPKTFVCPSAARPIDGSTTLTHAAFLASLATLLRAFIRAHDSFSIPWDDRFLLFFQYVITGKQYSTQLLPHKRILVIPNRGKKDILIKSQLQLSAWTPPDLLDRFSFLEDHPLIFLHPRATLIQISHLRF